MHVLFIDTHDTIISVGLMVNEEVYVSQKESHYEHGVFLMSMISELIESHSLTIKDIDKIVAVNGPGSFTGLRIGLTDAKMFAYLLDKPIYLVDSLASYLVSSDIKGKKKAIIEDNKGYYVMKQDDDQKMLGEEYIEELNEDDYPVVDNKIDVKKVIDYALTLESTPAHLVRANYVKKIEVEK